MVLKGQMRNEKTGFLRYFLFDTPTFKIRFWGIGLSFLSMNSHPGERESGLKTFFDSSRP